MDQLKHNAIECLRSLSHKDDVLYQRDHEGSSPCESSPAVLKRTIMPIKKRIFVEAECDLPSTRKRMKNVHDLTIIPRKSSVGDNKNGSIPTITSDSCLSPSADQEKPLCGGEKRSIMSVQNQEQRKQENNVSVPKRTLATDVESMDGKGSNEKNKREASPSSPVARQEFSYFKNGQVDSNKFPLKVSITSNYVLMDYTSLLCMHQIKSSRRMSLNPCWCPCCYVILVDGYFRVWSSQRYNCLGFEWESICNIKP